MASKRTFSSKKMLEELDKPTQPVEPSETSPVDVLTDGTPYDDRTAAALFAALQQAQPTPAPVAATTPVEPEVSTPLESSPSARSRSSSCWRCRMAVA